MFLISPKCIFLHETNIISLGWRFFFSEIHCEARAGSSGEKSQVCLSYSRINTRDLNLCRLPENKCFSSPRRVWAEKFHCVQSERSGSGRRHRPPRLTLIWSDVAATHCLIGFDLIYSVLFFHLLFAAALWDAHTPALQVYIYIYTGFLQSALRSLRDFISTRHNWSLQPYSRLVLD